MIPRLTLAHPTEPIDGVGLHSGQACRVRMLPAKPGTGIVFRHRVTGQEIAASVSNVSSTSRCTVLANGAASLSTVEHILSAMYGLSITDCIIEYDGPEAPAADGSALAFVDAIVQAGVLDTGEAVEPLTVIEPITVVRAESVITVAPSSKLTVGVVVDYPDKKAFVPQAAAYYGYRYAEEVAPARTYGFRSELIALADRGLARGASVDNAVAVDEDGNADLKTPFRFPNELARHKLLDLIGDISLCGRPLQAIVLAYRPGHAINARMAAELQRLPLHPDWRRQS